MCQSLLPQSRTSASESPEGIQRSVANGDKGLIYVKARKAILFDPVKNVIVDVAPVNIAQNQVAPTGTQAQFIPTATPTPAK